MLETTFIALQDIMLDKIFDEASRKVLCSEFAKIMQQACKILKLYSYNVLPQVYPFLGITIAMLYALPTFQNIHVLYFLCVACLLV